MAFVKLSSETDVQTGTSLLGFPMTAAAGALIVIGITRTSGTVTTVTDNKSSVYQQIGTQLVQANANVSMYYAVLASGGTVTPTVTLSATGTESAAVAAVFTGTDTNGPFDVSSGATGVTSGISSGTTATTILADELVVGFVGTSSSITTGAGFTMTDVDGSTVQVQMEHKVVSTLGTQAATYTGTGVNWACRVATFKALKIAGPGNGGPHVSVGDGMSRSEVAN